MASAASNPPPKPTGWSKPVETSGSTSRAAMRSIFHGFQQPPLPVKAEVSSPNRSSKAPHPVRQQWELGARRAERPLAGEDLEDERAECVDIGIARFLVADRVLRRDEAPCSGDGKVSKGVLLDVHQIGEAEITEAASEVGVEHDVAGIDVAAEHHTIILMVDIVESGGYIFDHTAKCPTGVLDQIAARG
jgi:hypothetical protein